jgi:cell division inhibitor SulA
MGAQQRETHTVYFSLISPKFQTRSFLVFTQKVLDSPGAASITSLDLSSNCLTTVSLKLLLPLLRHDQAPELPASITPGASFVTDFLSGRGCLMEVFWS